MCGPGEGRRQRAAGRTRGFWRAGERESSRSPLHGELDGLLAAARAYEQGELARRVGGDLEAGEQVLLRLACADELDRLAVAVAARLDHVAVGEPQRDVLAREREAARERARVRRVVGH